MYNVSDKESKTQNNITRLTLINTIITTTITTTTIIVRIFILSPYSTKYHER